MFCNFCKKEIPDDSLFCPECGSAQGNATPEVPAAPAYSYDEKTVAVSSAPATSDTPVVPEAPAYTYEDKTVAVSSAPAYSYPETEATYTPQQAPAYTEGQPAYNDGQPAYNDTYSVPMYSYGNESAPTKNKKKLIVTIVAALLSVALVATVIFTGFFGLFVLPGNLKTMHKSVVKTLKQKNFTVDITVKDGDSTALSGTLKMDMENAAFCFETGNDTATSYYAMSDGKAYEVRENSDGAVSGEATEQDTDEFEDLIEILPDVYNDLALKGKINDELKDKIDEVIDGNIPEQYEDYVELVYFLYEDIVSIFNDQDWLEEYAEFKPGAEKGCRVYEMCFTAEELTRGILRGLLSDNFRDELIDGVVEAVYDEIPDSYSEIIDSADINVEITTKHNKLQEIRMTVKADGKSASVKLEFSDYNKTDVEDAIDDIADKIN